MGIEAKSDHQFVSFLFHSVRWHVGSNISENFSSRSHQKKKPTIWLINLFHKYQEKMGFLNSKNNNGTLFDANKNNGTLFDTNICIEKN